MGHYFLDTQYVGVNKTKKYIIDFLVNSRRKAKKLNNVKIVRLTVLYV